MEENKPAGTDGNASPQLALVCADDIESVKRYRSLLGAIATLSSLVAVLLGFVAVTRWSEFPSIKQGFWLAGLITAVITAVVSAFARDGLPDFLWLDRLPLFGRRGEPESKLKGRAVIILFTAYLVSLALAVMADGGARSSPFSNLIVLNASFGAYLATQTRTKLAVIAMSFFAFVLSSLVYVQTEYVKQTSIWQGSFGTHPGPFPWMHFIIGGVVVAVTVYLLPSRGSGHSA